MKASKTWGQRNRKKIQAHSIVGAHTSEVYVLLVSEEPMAERQRGPDDFRIEMTAQEARSLAASLVAMVDRLVTSRQWAVCERASDICEDRLRVFSLSSGYPAPAAVMGKRVVRVESEVKVGDVLQLVTPAHGGKIQWRPIQCLDTCPEALERTIHLREAQKAHAKLKDGG